ncbi:Atu C putative [Streptomyces sp. 769]|nr:Atu C putative [Streptomyces sp. 769]
MEQHQWQHRQPGLGTEEDAGHRQPGRQALLRAGEGDRDPVAAREAELLRAVRGDRQHGRQQHRLHAQQAQQPQRGDLVPDALHHACAERGVDDQQDRAAVDVPEDLLVPGEESGHPAPQHLPGDEREQQLADDRDQGVRGEAAAVAVQHQPRQQRGDDDPHDAGERAGADRRRHIAAGDGGEGDGGLDRRGHQAQEEQTGVQGGRKHEGHQEPGGHTEHREDHERAGQRGQVEAPVAQSVHRLPGGEPGPVEEEEQRDGPGGGTVRDGGGGAAGGHQGGQADRTEQREEVTVHGEPGGQAEHRAAHGLSSGSTAHGRWHGRCPLQTAGRNGNRKPLLPW